ncbi:hypothetical protein MVES_002692 [Malassezia vespertilionis]|uniref:Uncharacterized protein n=1 Tax=Malassezia vespertilionis TaxID=2020962 RepID=A0A2N1JA46_9BASI|nr:hypothetical protein MVES_002692 [Malassezia vespertilionis]
MANCNGRRYYYNYGDDCLSTGARAGIGVSIFVIIVVVCIGMLVARKRRHGFTPHIRPGVNAGTYQGPVYPYGQYSQYGANAPAPQMSQAGGYPEWNGANAPQGAFAPPPGPPPNGSVHDLESAAPAMGGKVSDVAEHGTYQPPPGPPPAYHGS